MIGGAYHAIKRLTNGSNDLSNSHGAHQFHNFSSLGCWSECAITFSTIAIIGNQANKETVRKNNNMAQESGFKPESDDNWER